MHDQTKNSILYLYSIELYITFYFKNMLSIFKDVFHQRDVTNHFYEILHNFAFTKP